MAVERKAGGAAGTFVRVARDSYGKVVDHAVAMQERNVRLAQSLVSDSVEEARRQAEANRALAQELVERAEDQRDAVKTVFGEFFGVYVDLAFAPLSYYREGLAAAR